MYRHHHHQSVDKSQTLYTAFPKMSVIVMFVHYMVLSTQLLRCRPHLRTQSMVPCLIVCTGYSAVSRGQTTLVSIA